MYRDWNLSLRTSILSHLLDKISWLENAFYFQVHKEKKVVIEYN